MLQAARAVHLPSPEVCRSLRLASGLTEEQAARVFERFYRADSSRARASGGAGLGLSIVSAVVEAHGGSVEARQTPSGGATFVITLPLGAD